MLFALIRIMKLERINTKNIAQLLLFHFYIYQLLLGARGVEQRDKFMRKVLEKLWMRIKLNENRKFLRKILLRWLTPRTQS